MSIPIEQTLEKKVDESRAFEIAKLASIFFFKVLESPKAGSKFRDYLETRGLTMQMAQEYRIGAAPDSFDTLLRTFAKRGIGAEELIPCGLVSESNGRPYDKFRDRLMFTICDTEGRPVGFGGRSLTAQTPKYLNSSESPIFLKGTLLYNIHHAMAAGKRDRLILVEGYMDVLALARVGIDTAVASMGTSLTPAQARHILRLFGGAYILYDGDAPGQEGTVKAVATLEGEGAWAKVAELPEGKDPDDVVKEEGAEGISRRIRDAKDSFAFLIDRLAGKEDKDGRGKTRIVEGIAPTITKCQDLIERDRRIRVLSELIGISEKETRRQLGGLKWTGRR